MRIRNYYFIAAMILIASSCQKETKTDFVEPSELMSANDIDVSTLNTEAKRYYGNMAEFVNLTTSDIDGQKAGRLKSATMSNEDTTVNPILDEFINLEVVNDAGESISFFDLELSEREIFLEQWATASASDMTPKLDDTTSGNDLEEYVQIQNDAFEEAMEEFANASDTSSGLKSAFANFSSNDVYAHISQKVQARVKEKSESYAKAYLSAHPEISYSLKSAQSHPDYVSPESVLKQLRENADRGNVLINLPGSVWLSAYLFYYSPAAITSYVGIGKYPPGHVSIIRRSKTEISTNVKYRDFSISSQNWNWSGLPDGVRFEDIYNDWDCKAHLCYVKKRVWVYESWRNFGFRIRYPNANNVIAYAESQIGQPYCSGYDFVTAKDRTSCFICSTITWRSFNNEDFNIHRVLARWMPTVAPADIYLSEHIVETHMIN